MVNSYSNQGDAYVVGTLPNESKNSNVYWSAILAGAFAAAALTLALITLGAGLGFASIDDLRSTPSITEFSIATATWLLVVQWLSSAFGGYLAGRLRTKWVDLHTDEVFFRDTAHGFLVWAVSSIIVATFVACTAGTALKASADTAAKSNYQYDTASSDPADYYIDSLFRTEKLVATPADDRAFRAEAKRIMLYSAGHKISENDRDYLASRVSDRTGLSHDDAKTRVNDIIAKEKGVEEDARKAATRFALFTFMAMLVGAFIASVAGALGGRHRDDLEVVYTTR